MTLKVEHEVTDINKWKSEFEKIDAERKRHGVPTSEHKWVETNGQLIVTVAHTVTDKDKQKAFRDSPEGKAHRIRAGIVEPHWP
jgi:hypothetical protein